MSHTGSYQEADYNVVPKRRRSWFDKPNSSVTYEIAVEHHHENRDPQISDMETLVLSAFSSPPRLDFGTVKINQTRTCQLNFRNPHEYVQSVKIQRFPVKKGFSIEGMEFTVEAETSLPVYITWTPSEPGSCRELVMCLVEGAYRVQSYLLGTCPEPPKPKKQTKGIKSLRKPTNTIGRPLKCEINKSNDVQKSKIKHARAPLQTQNSCEIQSKLVAHSSKENQPVSKQKNLKKTVSCNDRIINEGIKTGKENDPRMTVRLSKPTVLQGPVGKNANKRDAGHSLYSEEVVQTLIETYVTSETECQKTTFFEQSDEIEQQHNSLRNDNAAMKNKTYVFQEQNVGPSPRRETYISNSSSGDSVYSKKGHSYHPSKTSNRSIYTDLQEVETVEYVETTTEEMIDFVEEKYVVTETFTSNGSDKPVNCYTDLKYSSTAEQIKNTKENHVYSAATRLVPNDPNIPDSPLRRITFIKDDPSLPDTPSRRMTFRKDDPSLPNTPVRRDTYLKNKTNLPNTPVICSPDSLNSSSSCPTTPRSLCKMGLSSLAKRNRSMSPPSVRNCTTVTVTQSKDDSQLETKEAEDFLLTPLRRHGTYTKLDSSISPKPIVSQSRENSPTVSEVDDLPFTSESEGVHISEAYGKRDPKKLSIISERSERERSILSTGSMDDDKLKEISEISGSPFSSKYATAYTTPYESPTLSDGDEDAFEDSLSHIPSERSTTNVTVLENSQLMASLLRDKLEKVASFNETPTVKTATPVALQDKKQNEDGKLDDSLAVLLNTQEAKSVPMFEDTGVSKVSELSSHVSIDATNESVTYHSKKESMINNSKSDSFARSFSLSTCDEKFNNIKSKDSVEQVQNLVAGTDEKTSKKLVYGDQMMTENSVECLSPVFSADDSIAHLLKTSGMKKSIPQYEDSLPQASRFSLLQHHERSVRSPSMYFNPFTDGPLEVSTLGFPNESFIDREKINLGMFKSLKKDTASNRSRKSHLSGNDRKYDKICKKLDHVSSFVLDDNKMDAGKALTHSVDGDVEQKLSSTPKLLDKNDKLVGNKLLTVENEIKQRLSSTPKVQSSDLKEDDYVSSVAHNMPIHVQTPSPIIGRRVSRDTITKARSSVLTVSDLREPQVKKGLFQQKSDNSPFDDASPLKLIDLKGTTPGGDFSERIDVTDLKGTIPGGDFSERIDDCNKLLSNGNTDHDPRRFSTLTITKTKPIMAGILESVENEKTVRRLTSKQLFSDIPNPEDRRISTLTVTKSKPTVLDVNCESRGDVGRKQLFGENLHPSDISKGTKREIPKLDESIEESVKAKEQPVWDIPNDNLSNRGDNKDYNVLTQKKPPINVKKMTRRSVAVMQNVGKTGLGDKQTKNTSRRSVGVVKVPIKEASPQKRDHSKDSKQSTRKRFRSEEMKKPPKVNVSRLSMGVLAGQDKKNNLTMPLRKQAALTSMSKNAYFGSTTKRTVHGTVKQNSAVKGLAKGKLTLIKQPKSQASMPKHPLPFAAKNMYYDERWMEKEERGFVKWLNFILTPPDFYFDARKPKKIDAGQLFLESNQYNITMAPTKEVLSFKAYSVKRKLNGLRRSSCKLYQSDLFVTVQSKLEREIECGRLAIRKDRLIFADLGLKQKILEMLLSYNPLWLRIGLETVYGEVVCVDTTTDVFGLSRFIVQRFLANPEIAMEYAHPTVPHLYRDGYYESLGQFTLKKFLMMIMFLDHAKRSRLIQEDPCLFCKDSEFKASKDILLSFSRDFLAGEGDLVKHLGFMGYKVSHMQTALEEVDYAVSNLAIDLRDGLRITRVVSLLTENWKLLESLRCPAISRLQKIHNVGVALKSLTDRGVDLTGAKGGNIDSRDIVEGHREKTLHLLWRIIFNFQVEDVIDLIKLKEEIVFLKKSLSTKKQQEALLNDIDPDMLGLPREPRDSVEPSDVYFRSEKLSLLLRWCRAVCTHFDVKVENFTVAFSDGRVLCYLLHYYHPELLAQSDIHTDTTQTYIGEEADTSQQSDDSFSFDNCTMSSFPKMHSDVYEQLLKNERENFKTLYAKVSELGGIPLMLRSTDMSATIPDEKVVITYVSYLCARLLDIRQESRAARVIQHAWRVYMINKHKSSLQDRKKAALVIQSAIRQFLSRRREARKGNAAIVIQCFYRGYKAKKQLLILKQKARLANRMKGAVMIQAYIRGYLAKKEQRRKYQSAVIIQSTCRGYFARRAFLKLKETVQKVQARIRANRLCVIEHQNYQAVRQSAITIQSCVRRWLAMKLLQKHKAATTIQSYFRMFYWRKNYLLKLSSVIKLQSHVRRYQCNQRYLRLCSSIHFIQSQYRANIASKKQRQWFLNQKNATITLQRYWRRFLVRRQTAKVRAVVKLQSYYRAYRQRKNYCCIRKAVVTIQRRLCAMQIGKAQFMEYKKTKLNIILLQSCIRGYLQRKELQRKKSAVSDIQNFYKMYSTRCKYLNMKRSAAVIQNWWRSRTAMKIQQHEYIQIRTAAIKVQSVVRMSIALISYQKQRKSVIYLQSLIRKKSVQMKFNKIKQAACIIQKHYRRYIQMKKAYSEYQRKRNSIIKIQSCVKMYQTRKKYLKDKQVIVKLQAVVRARLASHLFQLQKSSAVCIQRSWRSRTVMKIQKHEYIQIRTAAIKVQSVVRMYIALIRYQKQRKSVVYLQSLIRKKLQYNKYMTFKKSATTVQQYLRGFLKTREIRMRYLNDRMCIIKVQSMVRMHQAITRYHCYKRSVICIQKQVRMKIAEKRYTTMRDAAVILQRYIRGYLNTKATREQYLRDRRQIITVQSVVRMHQVLKRHTMLKKTIVYIQSLVRKRTVQMKFNKMKQAACIIQNHYRRYIQMKKAYSEYQRKRNSIIKIQSCVKMYQTRKKYLKDKQAIVKLQAVVRARLASHLFQLQKSSAICIQRSWRSRTAMKIQKYEYIQIRTAAIKVQSVVRMYIALIKYQKQRKSVVYLQSLVKKRSVQMNFNKMKQAACIIQNHYRRYIQMKKAYSEYQRKRNSIIKIQSCVKMYQTRKKYLKDKQVIVKLQAVVRARLASHLFQLQKSSAICIQRSWRSRTAMKIQKHEYIQIRTAAIKVQSVVRMSIALISYQKQRKSVVYLQSLIRKKSVQMKFNKIKQAACIIQKHYRRYIQMKKAYSEYQRKRNSIIKIQSCVKMYQTRKKYLKDKQVIVKLQAVVRARLASHLFQLQKSSAVCIQRSWRAYSIMKYNQEEQAKHKSACIIIQKAVQGYIDRKEYNAMKHGFTQLQALFRCKQEMKKFMELKSSALIIQERWRATLEMNKVLNQYKLIRQGIIALQVIYKRNKAMDNFFKMKCGFVKLQALFKGKTQRRYFNDMRASAVLIQRRWKATQSKVVCQNKYIKTKGSAVKIQCWWRGVGARRKYEIIRSGFIKLQALTKGHIQRKNCLKLRAAVIVMQYRYRATQIARIQRKRYLVLREAAITIQSHYRKSKCLSEYKAMQNGFIQLQSLYRSKIQQRHYEMMKTSAVKIEQWWLSVRLAKKVEREYCTVKLQVRILQGAFRGYKARKEYNIMKIGFTILQAMYKSRLQSKKYKQLLKTAVFVQRKWRAAVEHKRQTEAAVKIQAIWRGYCAQCQYERLCLRRREAAVILQYHVRKCIFRKQCRQEIKQKITCIIKVQACVRRYLTKNKLKRIRAATFIQSCVRSYLARIKFLKICKTAIQCQSVLRMYVHRKRFLMLKCAVATFETYRKAQLTGRTARQKLDIMHKKATQIQAWYKACYTKRQYLTMRNGFTKLQCLAKKFLYRKHYEKVSSASLLIQRWWRGVRLTRIQRTLFLVKKKEVCKIQRFVRRYVKRKLVVVNAAITIQKTWRGFILRKRMKKLQMTVITLQKHFRSCREEILQKRKNTACIQIQSVIRMYTARKYFLKTQKSIVIVQTLWRGRKVRKELKDTRIDKVRKRIEKANNNATEEKTLAHRTISALDFLLKCKDLGTVLGALMDLDIVTKLLPECCERLVEANAVHVLYRIIQGSNRSIPHQELIKYAVSTLLNLSKYEKTAHAVYHGVESVNLLVEQMSIYRDKKGVLFPQLCTLLGMVGHIPNVQEEVTQMSKLVEKLRSLQSLVARKHKMEQSRQKRVARMEAMKSFNCTLPLMAPAQKKRAKVKPEWVLQKGLLSHITDPMEAIDFVLESLQITAK